MGGRSRSVASSLRESLRFALETDLTADELDELEAWSRAAFARDRSSVALLALRAVACLRRGSHVIDR